jgi:hypothetical protein
MPRVFVSAVKSLLAGKVSHCIHLLTIATLMGVGGCSLTPVQSSVVAPKSTVIAQAVGANSATTTWLESATLSYARSQTIVSTGSTPAAFAERSPKSGTLLVLGVRYPHPDGHKDRARVELVIAEPRDAQEATTWYDHLGQALNETLPGIAWGAGIRQAKAIDLPLAELQQLLSDAQGTVTEAIFTTPSAAHVQFTSEVNGQHNVIQTAPIAALEKLVARVAREGRLIGYSGSANELQQGFLQAAQPQLAGNLNSSTATERTTRNVLTPFPPVITQ